MVGEPLALASCRCSRCWGLGHTGTRICDCVYRRVGMKVIDRYRRNECYPLNVILWRVDVYLAGKRTLPPSVFDVLVLLLENGWVPNCTKKNQAILGLGKAVLTRQLDVTP